MSQELFVPSEYAMLFFELFEGSSDAVFITRLTDAVLLDANASFLSLFALSRGLAIGRSVLELGLWVRTGDWQSYLTALRDAGKVKGYPARFRNRWGEEFTLALSSTLAQLRGEPVIMGIGTVVRPG